MTKNYYLPSDDSGKADLLEHFAAKLPQYAETLEVSAADLASAQADAAAWKPVLGIKTQAGRPTVTWAKGDADALEIWVDRGDDPGFVLLAIDLKPDYPDPFPLPPLGTSALWKYRAIYRLGDEQVGQWSDVISVTVGG